MSKQDFDMMRLGRFAKKYYDTIDKAIKAATKGTDLEECEHVPGDDKCSCQEKMAAWGVALSVAGGVYAKGLIKYGDVGPELAAACVDFIDRGVEQEFSHVVDEVEKEAGHPAPGLSDLLDRLGLSLDDVKVLSVEDLGRMAADILVGTDKATHNKSKPVWAGSADEGSINAKGPKESS